MEFLVDDSAEFVLAARFSDIADIKLLRRNVLELQTERARQPDVRELLRRPARSAGTALSRSFTGWPAAVRDSVVDTVDRLDTVGVPELTALLSTVDSRRQS